MALDTHFQCASPEGWHFVTVQAKQTKKAAALQRELRLLSRPDWFHKHHSDLISYDQLAPCKALPRPEEAFLSSQERASRWQQLSGTSNRQRISDETDKQFDPKELPQELWHKLQVSPRTRVRFSSWRPAFARRQAQPLGSAVGDLQLPILRGGLPVA